eukprot:TRINITY_DN893_c0_g1_i1.p1 TRINITY_DN893_c0_g1~~TRINITY_DN893_c0_g1_i1.p1  ORF type:complete len:1193 (+),score=268.35 TRINITY_DN893_c0_g1_i1:794-4372(+)
MEGEGKQKDGEELKMVDTAVGIKIVQVDPMVSDSALARSRRQQTWEHPATPSLTAPPSPFWERARDMFYTSVLTIPEVEALREGDVPISLSNGTSNAISPVGKDDGGTRSEVPEMGEEKRFSNLMREEWLRYLGEEILLLRIEKANETLDKESSDASIKRTASTPGSAPGAPPATPSSLAWASSPWSRSPQIARSFTVPSPVKEKPQPGPPVLSPLVVTLPHAEDIPTPKPMPIRTLKSSGGSVKLWWQSSGIDDSSSAQTPSSLNWLKWPVGHHHTPSPPPTTPPLPSTDPPASSHNTSAASPLDEKASLPKPPTVVAVPAIAKAPDKSPGEQNWKLLADTFSILSPSPAKASESPRVVSPTTPTPSNLSPQPQASAVTPSALPPSPPPLESTSQQSLQPEILETKTIETKAVDPPPAPYIPPLRPNLPPPSPPQIDSKRSGESPMPPKSPPPPPRLISQKLHSGQLPPLRRTSSLDTTKSLSGPLASQTIDRPRRHRLHKWRSQDLKKALEDIPAAGEAPELVPTSNSTPRRSTDLSTERSPSPVQRLFAKPERLSVPSDETVASSHAQAQSAPIISAPQARGAEDVISPLSPLEATAMFKDAGSKRSPKKKMIRAASGVRAAMKAAEAAATGSKRMKKVWEKMKVIVAHKHQEGESGPPAQLKLEGSTLSTALRQGEIPAEQRGTAWMAVACANPEEDLLPRSRYAQLLKQESRWSREIERDVNRTFPLHPKFREERGAGQMALFDVIKAYSIMDPEIGYCQGMAFVAAVLLMHMEEAEDAFCCFVYMLYRGGMRTVFSPSMEQLQVRLYQLSQLLLQSLPLLHAHLEELEIKPVMYAADWFLTLFARNMPLYIVCRVFDIIIAEKTSAIVFKLAIVLLQVCRRQLLQCPEMEFVMHFLRTELPAQLEALPDADLEELVAKALRVDLPFESLLRLEAEYDLLQEEVAMAARQVQAAAAASEAAAAAWENRRNDLEKRLMSALEGQKTAEAMVAELRQKLQRAEGRQSSAGQTEASSTDVTPPVIASSNSAPGVVGKGTDVGDARKEVPKKVALVGKSQHELNMARWKAKAKAAQAKPAPGADTTYALLKSVNELRKEKAAVAEALLNTERALRAQIHLENKLHDSGELEMIAETPLVEHEMKVAKSRLLGNEGRSVSEAGIQQPRPKDMVDPLLRSAYSSVDSLMDATT